MDQEAPLGGITVLDMSQGIAGPSCGGHFAEYGARVIKIEPPEGDWIRNLGSSIAGASAPAIVFNRGKESLALDLKAPEGVEIALQLAARCQVVIENARPGVMTRLGLGYEAVRVRSPDVVYISVSGWGQTGPNRARPMVDTVGQAVSGLMSVTPGRDGTPTKTNAALIDAVTGLYAFQAAIMALWGKQPGSGARHLDISLLQSAAHIQAPYIVEHSHMGRPPGLLNPPAGNYRTRDGGIALTLVTEAHFQAICRAIGRPQFATDPRFVTFRSRKMHETELRALLDAAFAEIPTAPVLAALEREGALASRINDYGDWLQDPHVTAIGAAPEFPLATGHAVRLPHVPGRAPYAEPVPAIGQHSVRLLAEIGWSEADIGGLLARGIVKGDHPQEGRTT